MTRLHWITDNGGWTAGPFRIRLDVRRGFVVTKDGAELGVAQTLPAAKAIAKGVGR